MIAGLMVVLIAYETVHFAAARQRIRHGEAPA